MAASLASLRVRGTEVVSIPARPRASFPAHDEKGLDMPMTALFSRIRVKRVRQKH